MKKMRNIGMHQYRFKDNPMEKAYAKEWEKINPKDLGILDYILSTKINEPEPVSDRDREVAATVIQWLGSPVGQHFVLNVLKGEG